MRLLRILLITSSLLVACANAPQKPSVELGVIDFPRNQVVVNMTGGKSFRPIDSVGKASYRNVVHAIVTGGQRVPLASYDRAVCFRPDWWQAEVNYIHALERFIQNSCGGQ